MAGAVEAGGGSSVSALDWVFSQPLGVALLIFLVWALVTERLIPGRLYKREQERGDRMAEAFETLSKAVETSVQIAGQSLEAIQFVQSLIAGIDEAVKKLRREKDE